MNFSVNPFSADSVPAGPSVSDNAGSTPVGLAAVTCPHCLADIPADTRWQSCPYCQKMLQMCIWPVVHQNNKAAATLSDQATCFFHPDKAFQACCQRCGRFMCALCDLQLGAEHVCPACFERGRGDTGPKVGEAEWRHRDVLYDSIAVALGWGWIIIWPTFVVALPAVIFLHVKYRKAPRSYLIPRSGWRFWVAYAGLTWLPLLFAGSFFLLRIAGRR